MFYCSCFEAQIASVDFDVAFIETRNERGNGKSWSKICETWLDFVFKVKLEFSSDFLQRNLCKTMINLER